MSRCSSSSSRSARSLLPLSSSSLTLLVAVFVYCAPSLAVLAAGGFVPAGFVDGGALGYAVVVGFPDYVCVLGEGEEAFDCFSVGASYVSTGWKEREVFER